MKIVLFIDTANNKEITVRLTIGDTVHELKQMLDHRKAQAVLPMMMKLLDEQHLSLRDMNAINVNLGPGSFTGLRVGITIANTLGFLLKIPINKNPVGELAIPVYS